MGVFDERNARRAIRIVRDPDHFRRDPVLATLEINLAIFVFVTTADVSRCQPTVLIAAAGFFLGLNKALFRAPFRNLIERRQRLETQRRREWAKFFQCHEFLSIRSDRSSRPPLMLRWLSSTVDDARRVHAGVFPCRRNYKCSHR